MLGGLSTENGRGGLSMDYEELIENLHDTAKLEKRIGGIG